MKCLVKALPGTPRTTKQAGQDSAGTLQAAAATLDLAAGGLSGRITEAEVAMLLEAVAEITETVLRESRGQAGEQADHKDRRAVPPGWKISLAISLFLL